MYSITVIFVFEYGSQTELVEIGEYVREVTAKNRAGVRVCVFV